MTDLIKIVEDAIWKGFEADDNACVDREMDLIDTGGTYETFNMTTIASGVVREMSKHGAILIRHDWREHMYSMLGRQVVVTINREPELVTVTGQLLSFDEGGEVALRSEDGFVRWSWPNLDTAPA